MHEWGSSNFEDRDGNERIMLNWILGKYEDMK
jgi:hypothetical protein